MCLVCGCDQILGIEDVKFSVNDVSHRHWVHVVNDRSVVNVVAIDAQIATEVSSDNVASCLTPFSRGVESLVEMTFNAEGGITNGASKTQVLVPLFEAFDSSEFRVSPKPDSPHPPLRKYDQ